MSEKSYYIGDSISLEFDLYKDIDKKIPWDLTNFQIRFEVFQLKPLLKIRKATSNVSGGSDTQIKLDNSHLNKFVVYIQELETNIFNSGTYPFEIEIYNESSKERVTIATDRINLLKGRIGWNSTAD